MQHLRIALVQLYLTYRCRKEFFNELLSFRIHFSSVFRHAYTIFTEKKYVHYVATNQDGLYIKAIILKELNLRKFNCVEQTYKR